MLLNWSLSLKFQRHRRCVHCGANNFSVFWHFPFSNMYTNLSFNLSKCNRSKSQKGSNTDKIEQKTPKFKKSISIICEKVFYSDYKIQAEFAVQKGRKPKFLTCPLFLHTHVSFRCTWVPKNKFSLAKLYWQHPYNFLP